MEMRIFAFKSQGFKELLPAISYVLSYKSVTIGWINWFVEFTTDKAYGDNRAMERFIKVIK